MVAPAIPPSAPFRLTQPVADAATAAGVVFADGVARGATGQIALPASSFPDDAAARWTPAMLNGVVGWWDAQDVSTLTFVSGAVSLWANKAAGGPVAAQATAGSRPTYSATGRNNLPALVFDGVDDVLPFTPSNFPAGSSAITIIAVAQASNPTSNTAAFSYGVAASEQAVSLSIAGPSYVVRGGVFSRDATTATLWGNTDNIASVFVPSGAGKSVVRVNGSNAGTMTNSGTAALSATNGRIGATVQGTGFWKGAIQEILVFNRALTTAERQKVEGYLVWRWNLRDKLRNGHPYKDAPPGGFATTGAMTEYEKFRLTETRPEFDVNNYAGATPTARILNAMAALKGLDKPFRLRVGLDMVSSPPTRTWLTTEAVKVPSNCTLLLDGSKIKLANGVFDNALRNDGIVPNPADPNGIVSALNPNQNIRVIGINGASIEGADTKYTAAKPGATDTTPVPWTGDDYGWRACNIVFSNVQNFEVGGFSSDKTSCWSFTMAHGVSGGWIHDMKFTSSVPNGDGIDIRNGCHDIKVERIVGATSDDVVCVCAAVPFADGSPYPMLPAGYASNVLGDDTYDIYVEDVSGISGAGNIVRAFTSGDLSTSLHHITIKNIHQFGTNTRCVALGTFGSYNPVIGSLNNITIRDVIAETADGGVTINAVLEDCTFDNIWNKNAAGKALLWNPGYNETDSIRVTATNLKVGP